MEGGINIISTKKNISYSKIIPSQRKSQSYQAQDESVCTIKLGNDPVLRMGLTNGTISGDSITTLMNTYNGWLYTNLLPNAGNQQGINSEDYGKQYMIVIQEEILPTHLFNNKGENIGCEYKDNVVYMRQLNEKADEKVEVTKIENKKKKQTKNSFVRQF